MPQDERPPSFERFDAALARMRAGGGERPEAGDRKPSGYGLGLQAGIEVLAGFLVGFALGWALDGWTGLRPLFTVLFVVLGGAAGLLNAYRDLRRAGETGRKVPGTGDDPAEGEPDGRG